MDKILFLSFILGATLFIYLLCAFVGLCNNVAKIRRMLERNTQYNVNNKHLDNEK